MSQKWVNTGCVDCGKTLPHPQPNATTWYSSYKELFSDINMTIYEDKTLKHFYIILHTHPKEKAFFSCQQPFMRIPSAAEVKTIMDWASNLEEYRE
jgi:hypothetical protein